MRYLSFLFITTLTLFFSCKKDLNESPEPTAAPTSASSIDTSLAFLDNAVTDACSDNDFFIKGEFNGHKLCFATTGERGSYNADTFMNAFFIYPTNDNIYLLRQNSNKSIQLALYCGQTHIKDRNFPYAQPNSQLEPCEFTGFELINMNHDYSIGQNSPHDNFSFYGYTFNGMSITFTRLTGDNIIEGVFEGTLRTNTGSTMHVKNGEFRIRFVISDKRDGG